MLSFITTVEINISVDSFGITTGSDLTMDAGDISFGNGGDLFMTSDQGASSSHFGTITIKSQLMAGIPTVSDHIFWWCYILSSGDLKLETDQSNGDIVGRIDIIVGASKKVLPL